MSEPESLRVFVNGRPVSVARDATILDALREADPEEADAVAAGTRAVTDSRGLPISLDAALAGGTVLRVVSARAVRDSNTADS